MSRETDFRPREDVHQCLISRKTEMISRETEYGFARYRMFSRETDMISRETKRCRAKVQTSFVDSKQFESDFRPFRPIFSNFSEQTENQAHRTASK